MKYIVVCGGVMSGIGKGVTASSLGRLLKFYGYSVTCIKIDPYLNIDAGTMSPYEHGECFVLDDGTECDLDLGTYERFLDINLTGSHNITSGKIYKKVLKKERKGKYLGQTVQIVPHICNGIKEEIKKTASIKVDVYNPNICIIELGGTVGDMEAAPFIESIRQMNHNNEMFIVHVVYLPYLSSTGELKTKPAQRSVMELRKAGLNPDLICVRSNKNDISNRIFNNIKSKLASFCNIDEMNIIDCPDIDNIYEIPLYYFKQGLIIHFIKKFNLYENLNLDDINYQKLKLQKNQLIVYQQNKTISVKEYNKRLLSSPTLINDMSKWKQYVNFFKNIPTDQQTLAPNIAIVGKYTQFKDSYLSLDYALKHAMAHLNIYINIKWIEAEPNLNIEEVMKNIDAVIIPGGFGYRGIETMIKVARYVRENQIPYLGICLGMHVMIIEAARNLFGYKNATSEEFIKELNNKMENEKQELVVVETFQSRQHEEKGDTMIKGLFEIVLNPKSKFYNHDNSWIIDERHRHRYEMNKKYIKQFTQNGFILSENAEFMIIDIIELQNHPFYVGCQFHPEFLTRHTKPSLLFLELISTIQKKNNKIFK